MRSPSSNRDSAWALANYFSNDVVVANTPRESKTYDSTHQSIPMQNDYVNVDNLDELKEVADVENKDDSTSIITITSKEGSKVKVDKSKVMPTWAATNSLLRSNMKLEKTNSEVVAPILRRPPTDHASLYTSLKLTQEISAIVVGPTKKQSLHLIWIFFKEH